MHAIAFWICLVAAVIYFWNRKSIRRNEQRTATSELSPAGLSDTGHVPEADDQQLIEVTVTATDQSSTESRQKASKNSDVKRRTSHFVVRLLVIAAVAASAGLIGLIVVLSKTVAPSGNSSPPLPVGALVWAKLERASPIAKPCGTDNATSLRARLSAGECSAIISNGRTYQLVNWSFPRDLDFSKSDSIAIADSTEIVNYLDWKFGGGYLVMENAVEPASPEGHTPYAPDSSSRDVISRDLAMALQSPDLSISTPDTRVEVSLTSDGRRQVISTRNYPECNDLTCEWIITDPQTERELLTGASRLHKIEHISNGFYDLTTEGDWGVDVYRYEDNRYKKLECYKRANDPTGSLSRIPCWP